MGIGDDAAIIQPDPQKQLVVSTDTLVAGVHFKASDSADSIGHKALAVNLSDLAAMGATPKWVLLNLTLPEIKKPWINGFIKGFSQLLAKHRVQLIGGDTTQGPLSITVTAIGETSEAICRSGARIGDLVVISGDLGAAAFALQHPKRNKACNLQLKKPEPRLDVSEQVKGFTHAMIDVSDGLLADLSHICAASEVAAVIELAQIPINPIIKSDDNWMQYVLAGGDDYQLCFTINLDDEELLPEGCHIIGQIIEANPNQTGQVVVLHHHQPIETGFSGFEHFEKKR